MSLYKSEVKSTYLVLLRLSATSSSRVELVGEAAHEATARAGALLVGGISGVDVALGSTLLVLVVSAGHVLEVIHCCVFELILRFDVLLFGNGNRSDIVVVWVSRFDLFVV